MEHVVFLLLLGLLSGLVRHSEPSFTVSPYVSVAPAWPPRTAKDLVLLLQGVAPRCSGTGQTSTPSVALDRWRQLLGFLPQLIVGGSSRYWLNGALKAFINASTTQGDLKHLLLWGISQNVSWGFLDLPLVRPPSLKTQILSVSLKADLPTFLQTCSDRLLPALKNTCKSVYDSINDSLQSACFLLTSAPQTAQMDNQSCRLLFSLLSDLLTDPCNTKTVRAVRSVAVSCTYATWYNSSTVSSSDVSTCSESDRQEFIQSVCGDQKLLNQLVSVPDNNWLLGFCAYNTNPENMCHYVSWEGSTVSAFSVAYCWLYDQDQFILFLCTNPNVLNQLKQHQDNQWLDPTCATVPPTNILTPTIIQELCNYDQWQIETTNPSSVSFCAVTDLGGFTNYVCTTTGVLQQLLIYDFNSWIAELCGNITSLGSETTCNYSLWQETDNGNQSVLIVAPPEVAHCSQVDAKQFVLSVCYNPSLLLTLTKSTNNSWVLQFCIDHICNYTTWDSIVLEPNGVEFCEVFDQEQLGFYLCSHQNVLQQIKLNLTSDLSCPGNITNTTVCSYSLCTLAALNSSMLGYCAVQDAQYFHQYICGNSSFLEQLNKDEENSWIPVFCNGNVSSNIYNCTDSLLNFFSSSCPNCNKTELDKMALSVCAGQNLSKVLDLFWNTSTFINKFIVWNFCDYSSWGLVSPPSILVSYCWKFDNMNFSEFVCSNFELYYKLSQDTALVEVSPICLANKTVCLSENDKEQLQWNCSADLSSVCPGYGLTVFSFLPIGVCYFQNAGLALPVPSITSLYTQVVDTTVILLLLLEEMQILSFSGTHLIRAQTLHSALDFITKETFYNDQKREFLQTFGNTLILLAGEHATSQSWILIEQLFNLTLSDLKVFISSLHLESAKIFLSILAQNWTTLQVSDDYFSVLVSTLLTVQVTSDPVLFCDVMPFLRYLEPDEMLRLLPPLQDNKEVLQALGYYAGYLSTGQKLALGFWLRRSTLFENITQLNDSFIWRVGSLLPLLSLDIFLQLNVQQVVNVLPFLPVDLSPPYQRIIASRVLQVPNITVQDVELMGLCVCQASAQDLERYRQNVDIFLALKRNLFQCVRRGDLFPDSKMLDFLIGDQRWQDPQTLSWESISNLSVVIPAIGYNFLQTLRPEQLLPALSDVGLVTMTSAQARVLVQKILFNGNVSDEILSHVGSLVLGFSPMFIQQLSANQLAHLLPALTNHASSLSYAQTLAAIRTLWVSWDVTQKLNELGPFLYSLPLILLRTRSKQLVSDLSIVSGVKWNQQQALLLLREVTQMIQVQGGVRLSENSITGTSCDSLKNILQDNIIQMMKDFRDIIYSLPPQVVRCVLDKIMTLPPTLQLLYSLSSQHIAEIQPSAVSILPVKSCRYVLHILKSEAQYVTDLSQQRRSALLDAVIHCLSSAVATSPLEQFVALGFLTPFLRGSAYLSVSNGLIRQSVEDVTNYCYPQEIQPLLAQLLEEPSGFGSPTLWTSHVLERLDRLVSLLPLHSLQTLNTASLSSSWLIQILSEERKWRKSPLGAACRQNESTVQRAEITQRQRALLQHSYLAPSWSKISALECGILRGSIVSAWGVDVLLQMTTVDFMDCLEEIGQDPDIPTTELAPLLGRVLEIAGPIPVLPAHVLTRLGRLATQFSEKQLQEVSLADLQVMEAFGKEQDWTMSQLKTLVSGFMRTHGITAQDLDALHLVTFGYVICGLPEGDMRQIKQLEFCLAVMYLGQLALRCTEQQLYVLLQLCTHSDMFGLVSGWTEDIFREIGSVAAGLQDMELSALVLGQIQGLTPLAISLIQPKTFAVSFSAQQLLMFSWSQAIAVTTQQQKLLDKEQLRALTQALTEDNGNRTYRAGKSQASPCLFCSLLHLSALLPVLQVLYIV